MRMAFAALMAAVSFSALPVQAQELPDSQRQTQLLYLLRNDCGACHGMSMRGGLGLPLTPSALADKSVDGLVATVLNGRPGTAMPPWKSFIAESEARWLIETLQKGL